MGDIPGPSSAPYLWRGKTGENFARLCQFIMTICSDVLRDVMSRFIKPADLRARLDSERTKLERVLNAQQKAKLFPKTPSVASNNTRAKEFDISLLYTILRNICGIQVCDLQAHKKIGWGKTPPPGDYCLCACIEIIREVRNNVTGHIETGAVDNKDFHAYWNQLKEAVLAIEKEMTGADMYERGIDELYSCDLNPSIIAKYVLELKTIKETINMKRERIDDLEETSHNIEERLVVKKEKIDTQEMHLQRLEREVNCIKQQSVEQEERIIKRMSERITEQEERILKRISERIAGPEERIIKPVSDQQHFESFCLIHPNLVCFMYCIPCQIPVCAMCIIEKHQQHVLDEFIKNGIVCVKMKITGTVTKVMEFQTPSACGHMSCVTADKAWIGYGKKLTLFNVHGLVLKEKGRTMDFALNGDFSVTNSGNLLQINGKCIYTTTHDDDIRPIINMVMTPTCIYSSLLNNDILVGVIEYHSSHHTRKDTYKIIRYNAAGEKLREITVDEWSDFYHIAYIVENRFNGDICSIVDNSGDLSLKVWDKLGESRFTYTGRQESIIKGSVTTDILGHILLPMCDSKRNKNHVDMLDHNGNFLSTLLITAVTHVNLMSLSIDNLHRLWFAHHNRIQIYRYLEDVDRNIKCQNTDVQ